MIDKLDTVFSLPPVANEKIISFRVVPTYDKKTREENPDDVEVTPALLLLTQRRAVDSDEYKRDLKIIRCPITPVGHWGLEIGALPDPRLATEVQPGTHAITVSILPMTLL